jgi:uncharacterized membrane protein YphA (DoxX/SURF4 family)
VAAASPESAERMVECSLNSQGVEVPVMTTLFSTRTSLGHASAEKRGIGTVMLALVAVLALIVVTAAVFGAAPALAGAVAAVILLIAAFTIVWANG